MTKGQTIYVIENHGFHVDELEFLREENGMVYARFRSQSGRGHPHPKRFVYEDRREACLEAARLLEERANEHRESAQADFI